MGRPVHSAYRRVDQSEILSQCLLAIERKQSTLEVCVKRYPEFTELGELLTIADAMRAIPRPVMPVTAKAALKQQILAKFQTQMPKSPRPKPGVSWRQVMRLAIAFAIIVVVIFGSSAGLVKAAQDTVPGDSLYFIKRMGEQAQITFTASKDLPDVLFQIAQNRLQEINTLQVRGQFLSQDVVIDTFQSLEAALKVQSDPATREHLLQQATSIFDEAQTNGKVKANLVTTDLTVLVGVYSNNPAFTPELTHTTSPTEVSDDTPQPKNTHKLTPIPPAKPDNSGGNGNGHGKP